MTDGNEKIINIVGMGPGGLKYMTFEAYEALKSSDLIVGYTVYVELIRDEFPDTEMLTTPMRQETERCRLAFEKAREGRRVALICSGDAGIYGLASLMFEIQPEYPDCSLNVIAGITAAVSGASILGAPLNHDFCVISLSDLMTPWELIEKRLRAAALGDFCIAIYNPQSKKRKDYLKRACTILMDAGIEPGRASGYASNIGREGSRTTVCTLAELADAEADMFTTVFIGNSKSYTEAGRLITPRGYMV